MSDFRLFLVRHGQNTANLTREFSYRKVDYSLTDLGRQQARLTGEYFCSLDPHAVFTSPLKRAIETAQPIAKLLNRDPVVLEGFREINPGHLEGGEPTDENWNFYDSVIEAWIDADHGRRFPGGEDFHELSHRVREALSVVAGYGPGTNRVVVSHGGAIYAALHCLIPGIHLGEYWKAGLANCSITEVEVRMQDGAMHGEIVRFGDVSHIPGHKAGWR